MTMLKINGTDRQFPAGIPQTLNELLEQLGINQATVVAEINYGSDEAACHKAVFTNALCGRR